MRARALCGAAVLLIAISGLGLTAVSARAEEPAQELEAGGSVEREPAPKAAGSGSRRGRQQRQVESEEWWVHAREVLLEGLELSDEQKRGVDAILEGQHAARRRAEELQTELEDARKRGDTERVGALRKELRTNRSKLRNPYARIEQIRALLTPEQRPTFDTNRARLVAEGQQSRQGRQAQRPKRRAAGADGSAE